MAVAEAETTEINYPEWTEYRKKNGLDPLGMQNSSIILYQTFLPGISNVTLRMRYYGFYAWLCRTYAQRIRSTNPEDWKRFIRRAETLYALIAYKRGGELGVAGIEWAQKTLDANDTDSIDFATAAEPGSETYYLKQTWGIYGLAYRSQLFEIGIFAITPKHEMPLPSKELGEPLASAFASAIGDLADPLFDVLQDGHVAREDLDHFKPLAPSEIGLDSEERRTYETVLLTPADAMDKASLLRRRTILLILKVTELLGRKPTPDEVRWILFAGRDQSDGELALGSDTATMPSIARRRFSRRRSSPADGRRPPPGWPRGGAQARPPAPAPVHRGATGPSRTSAVAPGAAGSSPRRCARLFFRRGQAAGRSAIA